MLSAARVSALELCDGGTPRVLAVCKGRFGASCVDACGCHCAGRVWLRPRLDRRRDGGCSRGCQRSARTWAPAASSASSATAPFVNRGGCPSPTVGNQCPCVCSAQHRKWTRRYCNGVLWPGDWTGSFVAGDDATRRTLRCVCDSYYRQTKGELEERHGSDRAPWQQLRSLCPRARSRTVRTMLSVCILTPLPILKFGRHFHTPSRPDRTLPCTGGTLGSLPQLLSDHQGLRGGRGVGGARGRRSSQ